MPIEDCAGDLTTVGHLTESGRLRFRDNLQVDCLDREKHVLCGLTASSTVMIIVSPHASHVFAQPRHGSAVDRRLPLS